MPAEREICSEARGPGRYGSMTAVPTVARWFSQRSDLQRVELYTRWSFYTWLGATPLFALLAASSSEPVPLPPVVLYVVGSVVTAVATIVLCRAGLDEPAGEPGTRRAPIAIAVGAAFVTAAVGWIAFSPDAESAALPWSIALPLVMVLVAGATRWPARALGWAGAGVGVLTGVGVLAARSDAVAAALVALTFAVTAALLGQAFRLTVWILQVVREMDRTRGVQAQLAVAEERLRFARDLHDVMGRTLSAIAVKSQLAGELIRRDRPEAGDEVAEINRMAQESLREVRDVVRGYRTADIASELAGARSILRAAGISCTVIGEEHGEVLGPAAQTALGWVVREAVTNVLRHSRATQCEIGLTIDGPEVRLRIANDGASATGGAWGNGLRGLAERLADASGTIQAGGEDGRFVVVATLPIGAPA